MEETGFCKGVVESDFGADENDFGFEEKDLNGSGTRWEAGLLMHSQHLRYKLEHVCIKSI